MSDPPRHSRLRGVRASAAGPEDRHPGAPGGGAQARVTQPSRRVTISGAHAPTATVGTEPLRAQICPPSPVQKVTGHARFRGHQVIHAPAAV
jgi:hypothetical protein